MNQKMHPLQAIGLTAFFLLTLAGMMLVDWTRRRLRPPRRKGR